MFIFGKEFRLAPGLIAVAGKQVGQTSDVFRSTEEENKVYEGKVIDAHNSILIGMYVLLPHKATNVFVDGETVTFIYRENEILAWSEQPLTEPS